MSTTSRVLIITGGSLYSSFYKKFPVCNKMVILFQCKKFTRKTIQFYIVKALNSLGNKIRAYGIAKQIAIGTCTQKVSKICPSRCAAAWCEPRSIVKYYLYRRTALLPVETLLTGLPYIVATGSKISLLKLQVQLDILNFCIFVYYPQCTTDGPGRC
jgi:hypothetical protein